MNPIDIIEKYYEPGTRLHRILIHHGNLVAQKALEIAWKLTHLEIDPAFLEEAAMLHDIGIFLTDTPSIGCRGKYPYICHGYLGREILERHGMTKHALVCERHVGVGIDMEDIRKFNLPIPHREMVPVTLEEQIICFADKFFSKNGASGSSENGIPEIEKSLEPYGPDKVARFQNWVRLFEEDPKMNRQSG
ncbi:MAG: HD domain-containing protein [Pseudomonadota bacterium]